MEDKWDKMTHGTACDFEFYAIRLDNKKREGNKPSYADYLTLSEAERLFTEMQEEDPSGIYALGVTYHNAVPEEGKNRSVGSIDLVMYKDGNINFPEAYKEDPIIMQESLITINTLNILRERYGVELDDEYETIDFYNAVDENEELLAEDGKVGGILWLTDDKYKALYERAGVPEAMGISFDEVINEGDSYLYAFVNVKQDKDVTLTLSMLAVDSDDTDHYAVPLKDEEKATLLEDVDRAAKCDGTTLDELLAEAAEDMKAHKTETIER